MDKIQVFDNGPIRVSGDIELLDAKGNAFQTKAVYSLCRCGASDQKPFCDGTHKKIEFESKIRAEEQADLV
ncbi:CDGSH iron-sulfur domain-containing protein [Bacillaceae bacterium Marseille-Q3522]|nr:CDGSH iron-sulfur domain-containing protein [Bacillaceae bacterium Marseille-Q3522]